MLGHRPLRLSDYPGILRRRGWLALIPLIIVPLIAVASSFLITPQYLSKTLVLIESSKVADNIVKPVVSGELDSRLASMKEQILSRSSLQPIIDRYNLYTDENLNMDERIELARKSIGIEPITPEVAHTNGLPGFFISFRSGDPHTAQQVCTEITSLFVQQNVQLRSESAEGTVAFLQSSLNDAKRSLDEQDAKLAAFEQKYMGRLPGEVDSNSNMLSSLSTQLEAANQSLARMQQDKSFAESMLAQQLGQTVAGETVTKTGPPIPSGPTSEQDREMIRLQNQKADLLSRYTPEHPDVLATDRQISALKAEIARNPPIQRTAAAVVASNRPESVSIQNLRAQIRSADIGITAKKQEQAQIQAAINNYQGRLEASPAVEAQYKELTRDTKQAQAFYDDLLAKLNTSNLATNLEKRQQGEQFRVMDAANLPDQPYSPKRGVFLMGGLAAGLLLGVVLVAWREFKDTALREEFDIQYFLNLPTLTTLAFAPNVPQRRSPGEPREPREPRRPLRSLFRRAPQAEPLVKDS